jgi:hypothetical protein
MKFYIYVHHDWSTTHEFLEYIHSFEAEDYVIGTIVSLLNMILNRKNIPLFIENSIDRIVRDYGKYEVPESGYRDPLNSHIYFETIGDILGDKELIQELFNEWTELEEEPLVIVSENDVCSKFIFSMFPPHEKFT